MARFAFSGRTLSLALASLLMGTSASAGQATPPPANSQTVDRPAPTAPSGPQSATAQAQVQVLVPASAPDAIGPASATSAVIDLGRLKNALEKPALVRIDPQQLRYYMRVLGKQTTFAEFAKGYDWKNGPTKGGNPMTHQEVRAMVTPKYMYSAAGIKPIEMLQFALTNWAGQALIKKALNDISNARDEREIREIRARIDRELAALKGGGE
jgi:hypothetical protein